MLRQFFARGVLYWLRTPKDCSDLHDDEWLLAIARLLFGVCCLLAIFNAEGTAQLHLYEALSASFLIYSLAILVTLGLHSNARAPFYVLIQCADVLWAVYLILFIRWPGMEFAIFFFLVASAGFRWGFWETELTNVIFCLALIAGCFLYHIGFRQLLPFQQRHELIHTLILCLALTVIVGVLAELKAVRLQEYQISKAVKNLSLASGLEQALQNACARTIRLYGATQVLIALHQKKKDQPILLSATGLRPILFT